MPKPRRISEYRTRQLNADEVRISTWGIVPDAIAQLIAGGLWGQTQAEVYYNLAMSKLRELRGKGWT